MTMKNRKGLKKIAACLTYATLLLQTQANEIEREDNYNNKVVTLLNHNVFENINTYLNAADILNLVQTCKAFFKETEDKKYIPSESTRNMYLYYKYQIFNGKYFQIYKKDNCLLQQNHIIMLETSKYIKLSEKEDQGLLGPKDQEALKSEEDELKFMKKVAIIDNNTINMLHFSHRLNSSTCTIF